MIQTDSGRRQFIKKIAVGAAVLGGAPVACTSSNQPSASRTIEAFQEAWSRANSDRDRWSLVREQYLLESGFAYFNTGGLGPTPELVLTTMDSAHRELERRCETGHGRRASVHGKAQELLGCSEAELAFTRNATEGMNLVARGISLRDGDEVVMTTHEHPGGATPWFAKREEVGIQIRSFDPGAGADDTLDRLRAVLSRRTRVVMVSQITCTHGLVLPVEEISEICRERNIILVVDGAQAVGQVPVNFHSLDCDFYVASCHKWMGGPKGTGILCVRDAMLDRWDPSYVGAYSDEGFDLATGSFRRLRPASASEYGTRNTPLLLGLGSAMDFIDTIGLGTYTSRGRELAERLRNQLIEIEGVEILTPSESNVSASILAFRVVDSEDNPWDWCNRLLRDHGLRLRPVGEAGLNAIRASTHVCNGEDEIDRLAGVLGELV